MMKPVDSQGQRGVYRVDGFGELSARFGDSMSFSKSGQVILEKFIDGDEVSVNAYVADGQIVFSILSDRESFKALPGGIIKAHHLPSKYEGTAAGEKVTSLVHDAVRKLQIQNGPVYFQIKIQQGNPYLIEVTPRLDGCHMWRLIKQYCGVDLLISRRIEPCTRRLTEKLRVQGRPAGTRTDLTGLSPKELGNGDIQQCVAAFKRMYYKEGETIRRMNGYAEKCGYRIFGSPRKIALIGGSGMIGKCFQELFSQEFTVKDVSRSTGGVQEYSYDQLLEALTGCDSVVILAAKKVVPQAAQSLGLYLDNGKTVENALRACRTLGIRNIVYLSSRCVYSRGQDVPIAENGNIAPVNHYGISKYIGELLCEYENREHGANIKILRLSQVIGAGESGYIVDTFVRQARSGAPLTVFGRAEGKRDYIYVKDVCSSIRSALMHYDAVGVYNIGSGIGTTALELAEAMVEGFGSSSAILQDPDKQEDPTACFLDTGKARRELGFGCAYDLRGAFADMKKSWEGGL